MGMGACPRHYGNVNHPHLVATLKYIVIAVCSTVLSGCGYDRELNTIVQL